MTTTTLVTVAQFAAAQSQRNAIANSATVAACKEMAD